MAKRILFIFISAVSFAADVRLIHAVEMQDDAAARALLKQGVDVNATAADGATALQWAAHWDNLDLAGQMLRAGAKVNAANGLGVTALSLSCGNGSAAMVARLLKAGADPNLTQPSGETSLMTCSGTGNLDAVKSLLARDARVNLKENRRGQTALMWAVARQHDEIAQLLIEHAADVNARSKNGFTPLQFAAQQGDLKATKMLLAAGARVNDIAPEYGSALVVAAASGFEPLAMFLLDQGADPDAADSSGMTAMHYALLKGISRLVGLRVELIQQGYMFRPNMTNLVKALLAHHANPNLKLAGLNSGLPTGNGWAIDPTASTPFLLATASLDLGAMRMLIEGGADPLAGTKEHNTPLMLAAGLGLTRDRSEAEEAGALEAVKMLVQLGADVNAADSTGQTALHGAAYIASDGVIRYLVSQGAKVDSKDSYGMTPLTIAEGIAPPDLRDIDKNPSGRAQKHRWPGWSNWVRRRHPLSPALTMRYSWSMTAGETRWNASACSMLLLPENPAAGVVRPLRGPLRIIFTQIILRSHLGHGGVLQVKNRGDIQERVGNKSAQFRLMRLEQQQSRRFDGLKRACNAGAGSQLARALRGGVGGAVVRVEGILHGMGENDGRLESSHGAGKPVHGRAIQLQRVIAQIEGFEGRAQDPGRRLCFLTPDCFHIFLGLTRFLPELAGLTAFSVRERDHVSTTAQLGSRWRWRRPRAATQNPRRAR